MKGIAICKCGHDTTEHLRTVDEIHHCQVCDCDCNKFKWSSKRIKVPIIKRKSNSK